MNQSIGVQEKNYDKFSLLRNKIYSRPYLKWDIANLSHQICLSPSYFQHLYKNILALHAWLTSYMPGSNMQNNCSAPLPSPFAISLNSAGMRMMYTLCGSLRKWRGWRLRNIEIALWCSILHFLLLTVISRIYISFLWDLLWMVNGEEVYRLWVRKRLVCFLLNLELGW